MCQLTKLLIASWLPRCSPTLPAFPPVLPAVLPTPPVVLVVPLSFNTATGNTWTQESMQFAATDGVRPREMDIKVKSVVTASILTVF